MEWLDAISKIVPIFGPGGAVALALLVWEKIEHGKTKTELKKCYDQRIAEAMSMTTVVAASNEASNARDASQQELSRSFQTLTTTLQLTQIGAHLGRNLQ